MLGRWESLWESCCRRPGRLPEEYDHTEAGCRDLTGGFTQRTDARGKVHRDRGGPWIGSFWGELGRYGGAGEGFVDIAAHGSARSHLLRIRISFRPTVRAV